MKPHAQPAGTATPLTVHIASGQILWACLPPGCILHTTQGEITIGLAPCLDGYAMPAPQQAALKAGAQWSMEGQSRATWVQLGCATPSPAAVRIVEGRPTPGLRQKAHELLRMIFSDRKTDQKNGVYGALHATR